MIPVLFWPTDTAYTSNGLGSLADAISCVVTEERNGIYELELEYPASGPLFGLMRKGMIIAATHDNSGDRQPFVIYRQTEPIDGVVTFYAHHISYLANNTIIAPYSAVGAASAVSALGTNAITENPFAVETDIASMDGFTLLEPAALRSVLAGEENSMILTYGGELEFDGYTIRLLAARGEDSGVSIRYGKNLVDYARDLDYTDKYNAVIPYWVNYSTGESIIGDAVTATGIPSENGILLTDDGRPLLTDPSHPILLTTTFTTYRLLDLSGEFSDPPTAAELAEAAAAYLSAEHPWLPDENIQIDFVDLAQTEEYKDVAPLQAVNLCDVVTVDIPMYAITGMKVKVIRTNYNVLANRYDSIELGDPAVTLADTISSAAGVAITARINEELTQEGVFNRLTNFGQSQGLYLDGTDLYINASFIKSGVFEGIEFRSEWSDETITRWVDGKEYQYRFILSTDGMSLELRTVDGTDTDMETSISNFIKPNISYYGDRPIPYMEDLKIGMLWAPDTDEYHGYPVSINSIVAKTKSPFVTNTYTYRYTVAASGNVSITGTNLDVVTPDYYEAVAIRKIDTGNANVVARYEDAAATGSNTVLTLRNLSTASVTATVTIEIFYMNTLGMTE